VPGKKTNYDKSYRAAVTWMQRKKQGTRGRILMYTEYERKVLARAVQDYAPMTEADAIRFAKQWMDNCPSLLQWAETSGGKPMAHINCAFRCVWKAKPCDPDDLQRKNERGRHVLDHQYSNRNRDRISPVATFVSGKNKTTGEKNPSTLAFR
jgi:hypothetical protein